MTAPIILQLDHLVKTFPNAAIPAVNGISLALHQGEVLGLLGPSGCGKTTLLRLIAGFEQPQQGTIALSGEQVAGNGVWRSPEQRQVGMVFQDYALFPHLTVQRNVAFGLQQGRHQRLTDSQRRQRVQEVLSLVGLKELTDRYPHELSGGQQQRVALARAIAPQPELMVLDEPLSNLDVQVRLRLRQEIRDILKITGTSAVFVTHDQEEALSMCDRVAVMNQGVIEQLDEPEAIYRYPASRFVAEFVTQANFLSAEWDGKQWSTEIGVIEDDRSPTVKTAELMVPQEDWQIIPDPQGKLTIRDRQFLGRDYRYWLITDTGRSIFARVGNRFEVGDRVNLKARSFRVF